MIRRHPLPSIDATTSIEYQQRLPIAAALRWMHPLYKHIQYVANLSKIEQKVEDLNRLQVLHHQVGRYYLVMPLSKRFEPPIGQFSHGHVLYGDKVSFPSSMLQQLIERKIEIPWQFVVHKIDVQPDEELWRIYTNTSRASLMHLQEGGGGNDTAVNNSTAYVYCSVLDFRSMENIIFMPHWMMLALKLRPMDVVKCEVVKLLECTKLKLRPQSQAFMDLPNPQKILEEELRHYSSLTRGTTIPIYYKQQIYKIDVVNITTDNNSSSSAASIEDIDVETDVLPPNI